MTAGQPTIAVVGSNVAAMLATLGLATRGARVVLVTPTSRFGGHFGGLTVGGKLFDAGMTFLEFTSFNNDPQASVASYDPKRRNDAGRFASLVERVLRPYGDWRQVQTPVMHVNGATSPDLIIANHLSSLRLLSRHTQAAMRAELASAATTRGPLHASRKVTSPDFAEHDLETVSIANHGLTFHEIFIEPFCKKVTGLSSSDISALYHRLAWVPLFYPETLVGELDGAPNALSETTFCYPTAGTLASLIRSMENAVRALPAEQLIEAKITSIDASDGSGPFVLGFASRDPLRADHLVWAGEPDQLLELGGDKSQPKTAKGGLLLASVLVRPNSVSTLASTMLVPGDERLPFRVTNQSFAAGLDEDAVRISCEFSPLLATNGITPDVEELVRSALVKLRLVANRDAIIELRLDLLKEVLPLPTRENVHNASARLHAIAERFPGIVTIGASAPFGAASLNDQVMQGVKVAQDPRWSEAA